MKLKREHNVMLAQDREDRRRIRELASMSTEIENSSVMSNTKECRPAASDVSLFTNSAIQESTMSKGGKKKTLFQVGGDREMLTINKTL